MRRLCWVRALLLPLGLAVLAAASGRASDWDDATKDYELCAARLGESRTLLSDFAAGVKRMEAVRALARDEDAGSFERFLEEKSERRGALESRIGRVGKLFDKVGTDLEKERKKGGPCPECIVSALSLLKRAVEDLSAQLAEEVDSVHRFQGSVTRLRDVRTLVEGGRARMREAAAVCQGTGPSDACAEQLPRASAAQTRAEDSLARDDEPAAIRHALEVYEIVGRLRHVSGDRGRTQ